METKTVRVIAYTADPDKPDQFSLFFTPGDLGSYNGFSTMTRIATRLNNANIGKVTVNDETYSIHVVLRCAGKNLYAKMVMELSNMCYEVFNHDLSLASIYNCR